MFSVNLLVLCKLRLCHLRLRKKNSGSGKKTSAPAENFRLVQICQNWKFLQFKLETPSLFLFKGKWQQKFLSAYLKETPKQYIEVYYRIFIPALFGEIF